MTSVRWLCSLLGILVGIGVLVLAQPGVGNPMSNPEGPTMGILVGSAGRTVGISVNPVADSLPESSVVGGTARETMIASEGGSWSTVITTADGEFQVEASFEVVEDQHTFTYDVTNLSVDGSDTGIELRSLAIPLAGNARPEDISEPSGWDVESSLGSLGGFLLVRSGDEQGVSIGETASFRFSLPALRGLDDSGATQEMPLPPGIFLGADLEASPDTIRVLSLIHI